MTADTVIRPTPWGEHEIRGPVHVYRERLLLRAFTPLLSDGRVLDAGCGSGSLALALCKAGYRTDALEQSGEFVRMVRHAMARYGSESRMTVQQGSVAELPYADACFDGLVCGEVLEHVTPDQGGDAAAVGELNRVLKPGGACAISVPLNPRLWDDSDVWAGHVKRYHLQDLAGLFERGGFEVVETRVWGFPLGRLYHRLLFSPWIQRVAGNEREERGRQWGFRAASSRRLVDLVARALQFDELFAHRTWGRGIVLSGRKIG